MKPAIRQTGKVAAIVLALAISIGLLSWGTRQTPSGQPAQKTDTLPEKKQKEKKTRDLDEIFSEKEMAEFSQAMAKMQEELARAMKEIDGEKIRLEVEKALKEVDMEKIGKEIQASLAAVDWNKTRTEIERALKEVDMEKIQQEIRASMANADWEKMKTELEKFKSEEFSKEMQKLKAEMEELGPRIRKEMEKAKGEMEKAKESMKAYKEFINGLEKDGLLSKKEGYELEHRNGRLLINGKAIQQADYDRYRSFLEAHPSFRINTKDDNFNISLD